MNDAAQPRLIKFKKGWQFTKSSWTVLRADKGLTAFPAFSVATLFVLFTLFFLFIGRHHAFYHRIAGQTVYTGRGLVIWVAMLLVLSVVSNFFTAALMSGAMKYFEDGRPTFGKSMRGAWRKVVPILYFSLYAASVGLVFQLLAERLPFVGKLFVWLADLSWAIANFFSLPVILFSDKFVPPIEATKRSAGLIKKVWGEGVVASTSMGLVGLLGLLALMLAVFLLAMLGGAFSLGAGYFIPLAIGTGVGYLVLLVVMTALGGILKAALYYYVTTGEAPTPYTAEALKSAIVPKKLRVKRLFSRV